MTLPAGAEITVPVHYSAAGQSYPSRLTVQLESTARNAEGEFGVPFRGTVVTVDEILRGIARLLGLPGGACVAFGDATAVSDLVAAVDHALHGCDTSPP